MLESIRRHFNHTLYIRVRSNSFQIRHIEGKREFSAVARQPFSHECVVVGDVVVAEQTLKYGFKRLFERVWFQPSPAVVIHPLENVEGGLSDVEVKALQDLAISAGARRVVIWVGPELTDKEVMDKAHKVVKPE